MADIDDSSVESDDSSVIGGPILGRLVYTTAVTFSGAFVQQHVPRYGDLPVWPLIIAVALVWTIYYEWWLSSRGMAG